MELPSPLRPLRFLCLKIAVTLLRSLMYLRSGPPKAHPDSVLLVPSRDKGRTIKAHVYDPPGPATGPRPVLVNLHGSGFVMPMHGMDDYFCRQMAGRTGHVVLDVQYRLAPEHPFPAAVHDVQDVIGHLLAEPEGTGLYDRSRLSLSGFSAGGNLSLVAAGVLFPRHTFRAVLAYYPPTDLATRPARKTAPSPGGTPIPAPLAALFDAAYIGPTVDPRDPRISPLYLPDPDRLPNEILVVTAAHDNLALEAEALAERVRKETEGKNVVATRVPGVSHGFDHAKGQGREREMKARDEVYDMAADILKGIAGAN